MSMPEQITAEYFPQDEGTDDSTVEVWPEPKRATEHVARVTDIHDQLLLPHPTRTSPAHRAT